MLITGRRINHRRRRMHHTRRRRDRRLDLTELHPLATQLHLEIGTAQILQHTISTTPHQVTGPVHTRTRLTKRIRQKTISRQITTRGITTRQLHTTQIQLTRHPGR
ncbi:MAG: hypothetical protein WAV90_25075, partial [Gordonia amarae]